MADASSLSATECAGVPGRRNRFREILIDATLSRPLIFAHRGDSFRAPENTLEAARLGLATGADAWELDVQLTRDGVPVVIHDESLLRTTNVATRFQDDPRRLSGYLVADFDLKEIQSLDAGSWFVNPTGGSRSASAFGTLESLDPQLATAYASGNVRIPTLAEALAWTRDVAWLVNVELKSFPTAPPGLLNAVLAEIDAAEAGTRVLLSSFDHAEVARAVQRAPGIPAGVLASSPLLRPGAYVRRHVAADFYHPSTFVLGAGGLAYRNSPDATTLRVEDFAETREAGVPVLVYTVNDCRPDGLATHLAAAGASGLFTDDVASAVALFGGATLIRTSAPPGRIP